MSSLLELTWKKVETCSLGSYASGMRKICIMLIALVLSFSSVSGRAVARTSWMDGKILYINYNNKTQWFEGWTDDARYYWEHGTLPPIFDFDFSPIQPSSNSQQIDSIIDAINNHKSVLNSHAKIINSQTDSIDKLIAENKRMRSESARLQTLAFTRVWTDIDGNSFTGVFLEYNLGALKVKRVLDNAVYTIPAGRLTRACKEMALALDKFK